MMKHARKNQMLDTSQAQSAKTLLGVSVRSERWAVPVRRSTTGRLEERAAHARLCKRQSCQHRSRRHFATSGLKKQGGVWGGVQVWLRGGFKQFNRAVALVVVVTLVSALGLGGAQIAQAEGESTTSSATASATAESSVENTTAKSEVVYATLSSEGEVQGVYVVNILDPDEPGEVTDYGDYESVSNLTDDAELSFSHDSVTVEVTGDTLSYQGNLGVDELPWIITVRYLLDGNEVSVDEVGGASGELEICIETRCNEAVDTSYYDNYLMQISLTFDSDLASNVATDGGQIAISGSDVQVTFMVMPGSDGSFSVTAQVSDFAMDGISFAALPLSFAIEVTGTDDLVAGFSELVDGIDQIASGSSQLASGSDELASGLSLLISATQSLEDGAGELASGISSATSGAQSIANGLFAYQQGLLAEALQQAAQVSSDEALQVSFQAALTTYITAYSTAYSAAYVSAFLASQMAGADEATAAVEAAATATQAAVANADVLAAFAQMQNAIEEIGESAGHAGAAEALSSAASGLGSTEDAQSLMSGAASIASALMLLSTGASELALGAEQLSDGTASAASGADELAAGTQELTDGLTTLASEVQAMPDEVQSAIDEMLAQYDKSDYVPISFTSSKNTNVQLVQFVFSTTSITAPTKEETKIEVEEEETSLLERFLSLFGL